MKLTSQFEYERLSRLIDDCNDVATLRSHCKALLQLHYAQKEVTAQLLFNKSEGYDVKTL